MIKNNVHKYSISAMCKVLQIPRSTYYYESKIANELNIDFNTDQPLVCIAFARVKTRLDDITLFHTDRGNEFKNKIKDEVLDTFKIKHS